VDGPEGQIKCQQEGEERRLLVPSELAKRLARSGCLSVMSEDRIRHIGGVARKDALVGSGKQLRGNGRGAFRCEEATRLRERTDWLTGMKDLDRRDRAGDADGNSARGQRSTLR